MKTSDRIAATAPGSRYATAAFTLLLAAALFTNPAQAQRERNGGGQRNGTVRETPARREAPAQAQGGGTRRSEAAIQRNNTPREFNRTPGAPVRNNPSPRDVSSNNSPASTPRPITRNNDIPGGERDINRNNNTPNTGNIRNNNTPGAVRNNNVPTADRNINRNNNGNRPGNFNTADRRGNNNRPIVGTMNRPGYRPIYGYNNRPVYNAYNPSWRYGYLPRRNSYFYSVPSTYFSINFGGFGYRYWDGVFYRPYNNLFTVCAPPVGIFINTLPVGYSMIYVHDYPYYYYNGTYYDHRGNNYTVVSPPVGAVVESLPDGYETVVIDGETFYTIDGAQYKPVVQQSGEIWYEVIKAN